MNCQVFLCYINSMNIIILGVLLAVMQAAPPGPRKAADSPVDNHHDIQSKATPKQNPSPSPSPAPSSTPIPPLSHAEPNQNSTSQPTATNTESIFVPVVSPVPKDSFWWNRFYVIFTGMLVGIGALGAFLAYRTLDRIDRQAVANEAQLAEIKKAAEQANKTLALAEKQAASAEIAARATSDLAAAARDAAQAVVKGLEQNRNSNRARIKIIVDRINPQTTGPNMVRFRIQNVGFTRAFIINSLGKYLRSESPDIEPGSPPNNSLVYDEFIEAGQEFPQSSNAMYLWLQPDAYLTDVQLFKIREGKAYLHFYGFIRYQDVYDQIWQRNIHLRWTMRFGGMMEGQLMDWWEPVGPPEENAEIQERNPN